MNAMSLDEGGPEMEPCVRVTTNTGLAHIELTDSVRRNAITPEFLRCLSRALDCTNCANIVVITSTVNRAFSVGADLDVVRGMDAREGFDFVLQANRVFDQLECLAIPTIAVVNGVALGGGWELALACDLVIASETAVFALPEVKRGLVPLFGGVRRLSQRVGAAVVRDLVLTGRTVTARRALELGLITSAVPGARLEAATRELVDRLLASPSQARLAAKSLLRDMLRSPTSDAERYASALFSGASE